MLLFKKEWPSASVAGIKIQFSKQLFWLLHKREKSAPHHLYISLKCRFMLIFSHRVWKVRFMNLGAYPELLSPTRAGCSYGTKLVTQSVNKQTHSRCLHRSANTEEAFISVSNHVCGKRRGSVFPATAFSSQMISVLPRCCGEVFQFSIQNQDSQDKFNYKENIVTNYFQSNAQLLPQPQKEMPA